jgi:DNA-directed DNA polymerase III PolC
MAAVRLVPLHVHSWYSLLEGEAGPEALVHRAAAFGYGALALTDTNNLYGAVRFVEAARRAGVRPILGARLRLGRQRCTALVAEPAGYASLCRLLSRLHLGDRPDLIALLRENQDGLEVLVGDAPLAERLAPLLGPRLWAEVIRPGVPAAAERRLLATAESLRLRVVASVAAHFATPAGHRAARLLAAVRQGALLDRLPAELPLTPDHHLVAPEEFYRRFRDLPQALLHTEQLAERCRSDVLPRGVVLPPARLDPGRDPFTHLHQLCERGLARRPVTDPQAARQRMEQELALIRLRELADYFLVVHEIAGEARRQGAPMALRGSAGNALVCYLLGITDVDPLRFGLPLERFLHAGRHDLPDIDLDFDWQVRDRVIAAVFRQHGPAHTAMISTHLCLQPASAFREAAKAHGLSNAQISDLLGDLRDRVEMLEADGRALRPVPAGFPLPPARWAHLLDDARTLLGRPHHLSVHPGGVVITPRPLENYVPLQRAAKGVILTQFEKDAIEHVGLVKIDLLGNRALATVTEARALGKPPAAGSPSPYEGEGGGGWGLADPKTLDLLRRGDTLGVNQLESPAMRHLLIQMAPRGLDDVAQALALIRPGAAEEGAKAAFVRRRRGLEPVQHFHPLLEPLLADTAGLILYEDDSLRAIQALTGWSAPEADRLRKLIGKAAPEELAGLAAAFAAGCRANGVDAAAVAAAWPHLAKFRGYAFCKSHAVSYALLAWEAAYWKAHAPRAFWTAALNNNQGMYPRRVYVEAAKRAGLVLHPPCVNASAAAFSLEPDGLRVGLTAIRGLGEEPAAALVAERRRGGPYANLADLRRRVPLGAETLARLIRVGALDALKRSRPALLLELALETGRPAPTDLFPAAGGPWPYDWMPEDDPLEKLWAAEWELLGFLIGPVAMELCRADLPPGLDDSRTLADRVGARVRLAGLVATARVTSTQRGEPMQFVTLEDEWGLFDVTLFPDACRQAPYLALGPYVVEGVVEEQLGVVTVTAERIALFRPDGRPAVAVARAPPERSPWSGPA